MSRHNKKDIWQSKSINISNCAKVLIIGGGEAGYIKMRSFLLKGFKVDILSADFSEKIKELSLRFSASKLIRENYDKSILDDYEIVMIGTSDEALNSVIAQDCQEKKKVYNYLPDWKSGKFSVPVEIETENIKISIGTKAGSPKTALFLAQKLKSTIEEYDEFVFYVSSLRERIKDSSLKKEIMEFVNSDDFYEFYKAGKADLIIKTFYGGVFIEKGNSSY